jgi:osomolarity two-component system response regulator SSK1
VKHKYTNLSLQPVNFVWLERKVKEWGCMQALIDFDGWRKWKNFDADKAVKEKKAKRLSRASAEGPPPRSPRPSASTAETSAQTNGDAAPANEAT